MSKTNNIYDDIVKQCKIKGSPGCQYIKFVLKNNQTVLAPSELLIYMMGDIIKTDVNEKYAKFLGNGSNCIVSFGSSFLNTVVHLKIKKGDVYRIARKSFLVSTENIEIKNDNEIFDVLTVTCVTEYYGYVWISSFGSFEQIVLDEGEEIIVKKGMFLASHNNLEYDTYEGDYGMKFKGSSTIFIQTKNMNDLVDSECLSGLCHENKPINEGRASVDMIKQTGGGSLVNVFSQMYNGRDKSSDGTKIRDILRNI